QAEPTEPEPPEASATLTPPEPEPPAPTESHSTPPPPPFVNAVAHPAPARRGGSSTALGIVLVVLGLFALLIVLSGVDLTESGWPLFIIIPGLTLIVVGFLLFESILGISGRDYFGPVGKAALPALLILVGVILLVRSVQRGRKT